MAIFSRLIFETVKGARRRLSCSDESFGDPKEKARQRGVRGETFAYSYLRRHGYVFVARNYVPREVKGEIDLKQHLVGRTARRFLMERHVKERPVRFDVVAIEEFPGQLPVLRLHKNAFCPRM